MVTYYKNGKIKEQLWYDNGALHRIYGPAIMSSFKEEWFMEGKEVTKKMIKIIQEYNLPRLYKNWTTDDKILFKLRFDKNIILK